MEYSNNHTHLQKYKDKYYLFYHSLFPQKSLGTDGGFRSICVNEAFVDESTVTINRVGASKEGVEQIKNLDPFNVNQAETAYSAADISYNSTDILGNMTISSSAAGDSRGFVCVKGADLKDGASGFAAKVSGKGRIEIYLDEINGKSAGAVEFNSTEPCVVYSKLSRKADGVHDIYFVISGGCEFDEWQFI